MGKYGDEQFEGVIGRTVAESEPWWSEATLPPAGTPNVVMILLDDTGIAHLGCFGSSIETPNFEIDSNPTGISEAYEAPFTFGGTIDRIIVDTERSLSPDDEAPAEIRAALGIQ